MLHPLLTSTHFDNAGSRLCTLLDVLQARPVTLERFSAAWDGFREVFGRFEKGDKPVDERDSVDGNGLADWPGRKSLIDRSDLPLNVRRRLKGLDAAIQAVTAYLRQTQAGDHGIDDSPLDEACDKVAELFGMLEIAAAAARAASGIAESPLPRQTATINENRECHVPQTEWQRDEWEDQSYQLLGQFLAEQLRPAISDLHSLALHVETARDQQSDPPEKPDRARTPRGGKIGKPPKKPPAWRIHLIEILGRPNWDGWRKKYHDGQLDYEQLVTELNHNWGGEKIAKRDIRAYFRRVSGKQLLEAPPEQKQKLK